MRLRHAPLAAALFAAAAFAQQSPPPPAFAAPNLTPQGVASMASACAMCHGTHGRPAPGSSVARLAGRSAESIVTRMAEFREGRREATIMHQIAKGYGDAETAAIARYFEAQPAEEGR